MSQTVDTNADLTFGGMMLAGGLANIAHEPLRRCFWRARFPFDGPTPQMAMMSPKSSAP